MKKRLRKKLKIGEFKQVGMDFTVNLIKDLESSDRFYSIFLSILEENNFLFSGSFYVNKIDGYIYESKFKADTERNIRNIKNLLVKNPLISSVEIGKIHDAWN